MRKNKDEYNAYMKVYMLERYHARRLEAIHRLGGKCGICHSTDGLELDHKEFTEKGFSVSRLWSLSKSKFQTELDKCQVLCHKCHLSKTKFEGSLGDRDREIVCDCGKLLLSIKSYAGHKRWCETMGP